MLRSRLSVQNLSPGYFALVMATGILSLASSQRGWGSLSVVLLTLSALAYAVLLVASLRRALAHREAFATDLRDPRTAFQAFTFVAASGVLGSGLALHGMLVPSAVLLAVAAVSWLVLGYALPWAAVLGRAQRPLTAAANGTWFIWVVGAQSVAILASTLEPHGGTAGHALSLLAVFTWSVGLLLYVAVAFMVVLRLMIHPLEPRELDPPYWVSMGAIAITIVAGARLVQMDSTPTVDAVRGLASGLTVVLWAFATWLIPALFAVGLWRHALRRVPLTYTPALWSMVFPLGMYSVACMTLGRADSLPLVERIGELWIWVGLLAWGATAAAMVASWATGRRRRVPGTR